MADKTYSCSFTKETEEVKTTLSIKDIKLEDEGLSLSELAFKYGVSFFEKTANVGGTLTRKNKYSGDEAKKMLIEFLKIT